ncbi:DEP domain containing protein 1A [Dissostichus eleginoides]|uniref:DEP domain containing protein 1A n=1 Tax=Dissostichus eleginoides TaxID=100907 RepID=A0AAD9C811_DISEL|nr:DEP domain containing protein 1A [Dissostichus eleginoides]
MNSHVITPGPYRATKLWNEVTRLFRSGMPLRKHRQNFRHYASCFAASAAVEWMHQLLRNNSNFGPDVTRQQTVQLLKKFLKNHVIEDVKGRWGTEDLEDNNTLYRFPTTSPLKPIPCPASGSAPGSVKKRPSFRDREGFFKFRGIKKQHEKETQENVDPALQPGGENQPIGEQQVPRRELTVEDEQEIWKDITMTHLQRILGIASLDEVLDQRYVNPQNIVHNMTNVNKHGVVTLDDKTNDLPHWVLSAMKSLANWPKYDSEQPSYPGFERDVFKTVSDYFYSLPQPVLTYELYELFINVLVFCGYVAAPNTINQRGKRKKLDLPSAPPPAKTSFRSTECLLLSLLRQGGCDETESPMTEVLGGKLQSRLAALKGGEGAKIRNRLSIAQRSRFLRPRSLGSCLDIVIETKEEDVMESKLQDRTTSCLNVNTPAEQQHSSASRPPSLSSYPSAFPSYTLFSTFSSLASAKVQGSRAPSGPSGPRPASSTSNLRMLSAPAVVRRCLSSLDVSKLHRPVSLFKPPVCVPTQPKAEHSVLQPQCERVAIEALQLCTLLLPPSSRRKLQLLMRMMSRISQNVDMPRLHPAIGTRTLMVHTFSGCVLGSAEECDLDELLATRLVSFLMDHQESILSVPEYLRSAISDHIQYLRAVQVPMDGVSTVEASDEVCAPMPIYAFCRQISGAEFEQQKLESSQKAMEELLEMLLTNQNMSEKDRRKKLKQFQKQYPDIYSRRCPSSDKKSKNNTKPKIKPPLLTIKKTKALSIRN